MRVVDEPELDFSVEIYSLADGLRVVVDGELDLATAPLLELAVRQASDENRLGTVLLNLSAVGFVDPTGWRGVDSAAAVVEEAGGRLIVAKASPLVRRFMQLLGDHETDVASDRADDSAS